MNKKNKAEKGEKAAPVEAAAAATAPASKKADKAAEPAADGLAKKASKRTTLPSGLTYIDAKVGDGPAVKKGQKVSMRYIGKLDNGKVFDSKCVHAEPGRGVLTVFWQHQGQGVQLPAWEGRGHQGLG
jgi:FK506-binding nuclear protein